MMNSTIIFSLKPYLVSLPLFTTDGKKFLNLFFVVVAFFLYAIIIFTSFPLKNKHKRPKAEKEEVRAF